MNLLQIADVVDNLLKILLLFSMAVIIYKIVILYCHSLLNISFKKGTKKSDFVVTYKKAKEGMVFLSTMVSVSPFIGLAGTILHIIKALQSIGSAVDIAIITGPVSTALISTLLGLSISIPCLIAYNFFANTIDERFADEV